MPCIFVVVVVVVVVVVLAMSSAVQVPRPGTEPATAVTQAIAVIMPDS